MIYELEFPECPPSFNAVGHTGSRWSWTREKKKWQEQIELMLMVQKVPRGNSYVLANATCRFKIDRKRDEGNYRTILEKALGDALTNGGWLSDDTPDEFRFDRVRFDHGDSHLTTLILEVTP